MNIFAVSDDTKECAAALDDQRLVKMVLETAQLLSTAHCLVIGFNLGYTPTHKWHPCTRWAAASHGNFRWLTSLGFELATEYEYRFFRKHASKRVIMEAYLNEARLIDYLPSARTPFVNCARNAKLGLDFTGYPVHDAYKLYLSTKWRTSDRNAQWTRRIPPDWR